MCTWNSLENTELVAVSSLLGILDVHPVYINKVLAFRYLASQVTICIKYMHLD